jgi:hypothetical protein
MASEWYLRSGSTVTGPLTTDQLKAMGKGGRVTDSMEVSKSATGPWHRAASVNGLTVIPESLPTVAPPSHRSPQSPKHTTVLVEVPSPRHVTVEGTQKSIKIQQLIALILLVSGPVLMIIGTQIAAGTNRQDAPAGGFMLIAGTIMLFVAVVWRIVLRVMKWWHHD